MKSLILVVVVDIVSVSCLQDTLDANEQNETSEPDGEADAYQSKSLQSQRLRHHRG